MSQLTTHAQLTNHAQPAGHTQPAGHAQPAADTRSSRRGRIAGTVVALSAMLGVAGVGLAGTAGAAPAPGPGGPGSLTLDLHQPVEVVGHAEVGVSCAARNRSYTASASKTTVDGHQVTVRASVASFKGNGTYPGVVNLTIVGPQGTISGIIRNAQVTVTDSGGSVDFNRVAPGNQLPKLAGKTVAGTVVWACS